MTAIDHEAEYNNSRRVPEFPQIASAWQEASDRYRRRAPAELDVSYGPHARHRYDLYGERGPLAVYLHGGYWQEGDRTLYGFIAEALVGAGLRVAVPSYRLCPEVGVIDIVDDVRRFLIALGERTAARPVLIGHSAGGHLTAAMLATDWSAIPGARSVRAGLSISGIFELEPLLSTTISRRLGLDAGAARAASPALWPAPRDVRLVAAAGALEGQEFHRQSRELAAAWTAHGSRAEYLSVPGANHFTVLDALTRPDGILHARLLELAG